MGLNLLNHAEVVFWDFDGVIKESTYVKNQAYAKMFSKFGKKALDKVMDHHGQNIGISRDVKIPLYFNQFVGINLSPQEIDERCAEYSKMVVQKVIEAPWVEGVQFYLKSNPYNQRFVLVTGTPKGEIIEILTHLEIIECFQIIYGSPTTKENAIHEELKSGANVKNCLFIGDSTTDYKAAKAHYMPFLLRETEENKLFFLNYSGPRFNDFWELYESSKSNY